MLKDFDTLQREKWHFSSISKDEIERYATELKIDKLLAHLLLLRNVGDKQIDQMKEFILPSDNLITSYKNLTSSEDLEKATSRIKKALDAGDPIIVNGDPDADGITGTTVLTAGIRYLKGNVTYDFPTRSREGHGLQPRIIDQAKVEGCTLIITADCGSKDVEAVSYANSQNIDVIICDHHILGKEIPNAYAIVNPYRVSGKNYEKSLSGSGVAFKLILALFDTMKVSMPSDFLEYLLAVTSLGTISDRMSFLNPMNRLMVNKGIEALNKTRMEGIKALREMSSNGMEELRSVDISRTIVPRLNAPGRIGDRIEGIPDSRIVVDLLLIGFGKKNAQKATEVVGELQFVIGLEQDKKRESNLAATDATIVEDINERRKFMTSKIEDEIDALINEQVNVNEDRIIVVKGKNWNPGVIGIDTDRLKDRFLRPATILTEYTGSDYIRGSVRSIPTINMYQIIDNVSDSFEKETGKKLFHTEVETVSGKRIVNAFGGHAQACGFTFHKNDLESFKTLLKKEAEALKPEQFQFSYEVLETITASQVNLNLIKTLDQLMPFGQEFEYPTFFMKHVTFSKARPFGNKYQEVRTPHVEFWVNEMELIGDKKKPHKGESPFRINAVGFGLYEKYCKLRDNNPSASFDIIFTVELMKRRIHRKVIQRLRLNVLDIRVSE